MISATVFAGVAHIICFDINVDQWHYIFAANFDTQAVKHLCFRTCVYARFSLRTFSLRTLGGGRGYRGVYGIQCSWESVIRIEFLPEQR